jgi:peptidoglycan/xylan/chitin deacetylase (PgdA/CDA1 family)
MSWKRELLRMGARFIPKRFLILRGDSTEKRVALTFDDGPDAMTPEYIAVLRRHAARATFFVLGENCEKYPEHVEALRLSGHELAGHGFSHRRFPELSAQELTIELRRTSRLLPQSHWVRPPQGRTTLTSLVRCARAGYSTVLWSLDSDDWTLREPAQVAERIARARPGEIILLHEGQRWTLDALPQALDLLGRAGYSFVTLTQLLST